MTVPTVNPMSEQNGGQPGQSSPLLDVKNLSISFPTRLGVVRAVNGLRLSIGHHERVGIVGESGSGKTVTALSILQLLPTAIVEGEIWFDGVNLLETSAEHLRGVRGKQVGYVFQDPLSALNPVQTIGGQLMEPLRIRGVPKKEAFERAVALLDRVGIKNARRRMKDHPHEFSGGMRQRVIIAMAMIAEPQLIIADEPTTALDVRVQAKVLDLLADLADEQKVAILLISHDLGILAGFVERVVVMYAGRVVEKCSIDEMYHRSIHPYTLGLLNSLPRIDGDIPAELTTIGGNPASALDLPSGCPFHPRCRYVQDVCREVEPALTTPPGGRHASACHRAEDLARNPGILPDPSEVGS
ncbi:MAG TPA: ABC transporter ATP-binding protein [Acidimicrobiia bacterium]|nr:ABC transporter ATP-binding protein [Acidimicrobiia bacterium]